MVYNFFDKKFLGGVVTSARSGTFYKIYSSFRDNIWGADLANLQLISKYNKKFWFLLCFIDIFRKYVFVVPLVDKIGITITSAFQKF